MKGKGRTDPTTGHDFQHATNTPRPPTPTLPFLQHLTFNTRTTHFYAEVIKQESAALGLFGPRRPPKRNGKFASAHERLLSQGRDMERKLARLRKQPMYSFAPKLIYSPVRKGPPVYDRLYAQRKPPHTAAAAAAARLGRRLTWTPVQRPPGPRSPLTARMPGNTNTTQVGGKQGRRSQNRIPRPTALPRRAQTAPAVGFSRNGENGAVYEGRGRWRRRGRGRKPGTVAPL